MKIIENFDNENVIGFKQFIETKYENMDFVWPGFPLGSVGSLVAAGGAGKSFYALQKGLTVALGRAESIRGSVLYLPAEDPILEVGKRLKIISEVLRFTQSDIDTAEKNFHVWSLLGRSPDLIEKDNNRINVLQENIKKALNHFQNIKESDPFRLIIFDTLRRFHYADENDGGEMARVLSIMEQICQEHKVSCLFLHHTSKAAALGGQADVQQASRGSSVLVDNIRYQEFLAPMSKDEVENLEYYNILRQNFVDIKEDERSLYVRWGVSKQNYGHPINEQWLKRENGVLIPCKIQRKQKRKKNNNGKKVDLYEG